MQCEPSQQGRSHFDARSVLALREHGTLAKQGQAEPTLSPTIAQNPLQRTVRQSDGERARTPLVAFFNIPFTSLKDVNQPDNTMAVVTDTGTVEKNQRKEKIV